NNPVFVDLDFFGGNPSSIGNENVLSTSTSFICWAEVPITTIHSGLMTSLMGREGVFVSQPVTVSILGLSETLEGGVFPPVAPWRRSSFSKLFSSAPVASQFVP